MKVKLLKEVLGFNAGFIAEVEEDGGIKFELGERSFYFSEQEWKAFPDFFQLIEEPKFKAGDWVHIERSNETFKWKDEYGKLDFINRRLATEEEIKAVTEKEWNGYIIKNDGIHYGDTLRMVLTRQELSTVIEITDKLLER